MQHGPLEAAVETALGAPLPARMGVAVSGGGDSMALLHLLAGLYARRGGVLVAVTVDHGLRSGSADEAAQVARECAYLGVAHRVLPWHGWDRKGNLQDAARQARYGLMAEWARDCGLDAVALGHTADDQAETVLLRLGRRSGVDGMVGMVPARRERGVLWLRPLLSIGRETLRRYLTENGMVWIEDPTNADLRFDRIKARHALGLLGDMGIDADSLAVVAQNMAEAREALEVFVKQAAQTCAHVQAGAVVFRRAAFGRNPAEIQRRLLGHALRWIAPAPYPQRRAGLEQLMRALTEGRATTLGGCALVCRKDEGWLFRELNVVAKQVAPVCCTWDGRWRCAPAAGAVAPEGAELRTLCANGLKQCDNWRSLNVPRRVLLSHPALWHGDTVVSSPAAKASPNWCWTLVRDEKAVFHSAL